MSLFFPFEHFVDLVVEATGPLVQGNQTYFIEISQPATLEGFSSKLTKAYEAARMAIDQNLEQLSSKKEKVNYLKEVKRFLSEPPDFDTFIRKEVAELSDAIIPQLETRSLQEEAYVRLQFSALLGWEQDAKTGRTICHLTGEMKTNLVRLLMIASGADELWKRLHADVDRYLRFYGVIESTPVLPPSHSIYARIPIPESVAKAMDSALVKMGAVVQCKDGRYRVTKMAEKGRPFAAMYRLLVAFQQLDEPEWGDARYWKAYFLQRYEVSITEAHTNNKIETANAVFKRDLKTAYQLLTSELPYVHNGYNLPF